MNDEKLSSLLGLAQKAGKLASGELSVEKAVRSGKAKLLIVACDASDGTKKKYRDTANYYRVPLFEQLTKERLGLSIGKNERAALAVIDQNFGNALLKLLSHES